MFSSIPFHLHKSDGLQENVADSAVVFLDHLAYHTYIVVSAANKSVEYISDNIKGKSLIKILPCMLGRSIRDERAFIHGNDE